MLSEGHRGRLAGLDGPARSPIPVQRLDLDSDETAGGIGRTEEKKVAGFDDALDESAADDAAQSRDVEDLVDLELGFFLQQPLVIGGRRVGGRRREGVEEL